MLQHAMQVYHLVACQSDNREAILREIIAQVGNKRSRLF